MLFQHHITISVHYPNIALLFQYMSHDCIYSLLPQYARLITLIDLVVERWLLGTAPVS